MPDDKIKTVRDAAVALYDGWDDGGMARAFLRDRLTDAMIDAGLIAGVQAGPDGSPYKTQKERRR